MVKTDSASPRSRVRIKELCRCERTGADRLHGRNRNGGKQDCNQPNSISV